MIVFCVAWEKKCLQELRSFKRHKEVCGGCLHNQRGLVQTADVDGLLLVFKKHLGDAVSLSNSSAALHELLFSPLTCSPPTLL